MTRQIYTLTDKELTQTGNQMKERFLQKMFYENIISKEQKDEMNNYSIVVTSKSVLGRFWDKLFSKKDESLIFIVKVID